MPKPGMTGITLKDEVADLLHSKAAASGKGLNDYLLDLMMGPSLQQHQDSPGTVPQSITTSIPTLIPTQNNEQMPLQAQNQKQPVFGEAFCEQKGSVVRSPGFGPGFLPWQGNVLDKDVPILTETMPLRMV